MSTQNNLKSSTFFNTDKAKTNEFFKQTKVGSASRVIVKNGQSIAVPFKIENSRGKTLLSFKDNSLGLSEKKTIYKYLLLNRKDYTIKPIMHVGMEKKPLLPYDPLSYRNRLPTGGFISSHKNKSTIELGDRGLII